MLIAIEGVDGAGKRTLTQGLRAAFEAGRKSVASLSFPRYGHRCHADIAAEALHGGHGDLADSVYAMAVLFALDRAGAREEIERLHAEYDVVILDRYVASNAAYSAARLHQGADGDVVAWVRELEYGRLRAARARLAGAARCAGRTGRRAGRAPRRHRSRPGAGRLRARRRSAAAHRRRFTRRWPPRDWCGRWAVAGPDVDGRIAWPTVVLGS